MKQNNTTENQEVGSCCTVNSFLSHYLSIFENKNETDTGKQETSVQMFQRKMRPLLIMQYDLHRVEARLLRETQLSAIHQRKPAATLWYFTVAALKKVADFPTHQKINLNYSLIELNIFLKELTT